MLTNKKNHLIDKNYFQKVFRIIQSLVPFDDICFHKIKCLRFVIKCVLYLDYSMYNWVIVASSK